MEYRTDVLKTKRSLVIPQVPSHEFPQNRHAKNRLTVVATKTRRGDDFWAVLETFSQSRYR